MRNYELTIDGEVYDIRGENLPTGRVTASQVRIDLRTRKKASIAPGPNYDRTWNSIEAAMIYEPARANIRWVILKFMLRNNTTWLDGHADLVDTFGTDALRRVRELRDDYRWPVEERPRKKGAWWYRMNHDLDPPQRIIYRRTS